MVHQSNGISLLIEANAFLRLIVRQRVIKASSLSSSEQFVVRLERGGRKVS